MRILEEMYLGNISEYDRKRKINHKLQKQEEFLYNELLKLLGENGNKLDKFIDTLYENVEIDMIETYCRGVKIGVNIGLEVSELEL